MPGFDDSEHEKLTELIKQAKKLREAADKLIEQSESLKQTIAERKRRSIPKNKK